jgi:hypothetical protein
MQSKTMRIKFSPQLQMAHCPQLEPALGKPMPHLGAWATPVRIGGRRRTRRPRRGAGCPECQQWGGPGLCDHP